MDIAVGIAGQQRLAFSGRIGSFWGIALLNLLLTILTLGIFRFWAKTRQRRYLWAETSFAGEPLEYRGRGVELLVGALLAFAFIFLPLFAVGFIGQAIGKAAMFLYVPVYFGLFWLMGVGVYR
jgi:uncharacterized membrane protein YjgN (DUF898 family)